MKLKLYPTIRIRFNLSHLTYWI